MIRSIPDLPADVIGLDYLGKVTRDDYREALEPYIDAAAKGDRKLRLLAVLGDEFEGFEAGAMLEDTRVGLRNWSAWERIAVVTDRTSIEEAIHLLGWMMPGEVRVFPTGELADAVSWVSTS